MATKSIYGLSTSILNQSAASSLKTDGAKVKFFMKLEDGGSLEFRSEILDLEPFTVKGDIKFQASQLYTEWKYLKDSLNLEIADGKISLKTNYYLNIDKLESFELDILPQTSSFSLDTYKQKDLKPLDVLDNYGSKRKTG